jgi:hypothetical protein
VPDWTEGNQHDPGSALLELAGWLAGVLVFALAAYAYLKRKRRRRRDA